MEKKEKKDKKEKQFYASLNFSLLGSEITEIFGAVDLHSIPMVCVCVCVRVSGPQFPGVLGFLVSTFTGFLVSWFLGFLFRVSSFHGFLVPWCPRV